MNITLSRKFQIAPYEMHEIIVSLSDTDIPYFSGTPMERMIELRNLSHKMLTAELYVYHVLPDKETQDAMKQRTIRIQELLLNKESIQ